MAPIKFEEQLKEKLEERRLLPSSESWSELAKRLDEDQKKSRSPLYWWLSIAAGLLIMITIATQTFKSNEAEGIEQDVVEETVDEDRIEPKTKTSQDRLATERLTENNQVEDETKNLSEQKPQVLKYAGVLEDIPKAKNQVADMTNKDEKASISSTTNTLNDELVMATDARMTAKAVVDADEDSEPQNTSVTDAEIDALLQLATQELLNDKLTKDTKRTVDANALLESVQEDMGTSFRSRVFEALKDSYETVKTAVVQRNN